jgi:transposase
MYTQALSLAPGARLDGCRVAGLDVGYHHLAVLAMPEEGKRVFIGRYNWIERLLRDRRRKTRLYRAGLRERANRESGRGQDKTKTICQQVAARVADTLVAWRVTHVAMEDLDGMRERLQEKFRKGGEGAVVNAHFPYFQLQAAVAYACSRVGISRVEVDARYTSQTCWRCGEKGRRDGLDFTCPTCGKEHADANAARVIAQRGREEVMAEMDQARPAVPTAGPRAPVRPHADGAQERRESCAGLGNWPDTDRKEAQV